MPSKKECPHCGGDNTYECTTPVDKGRMGYAAVLLPGLARNIFTRARIYSVLCKDCGLVRFFADDDAVSKLPTSWRWKKL